MRNIYIVFCIFIASIQGFSQKKMASNTDFKDFLKTETLVVLHEDPFSGFDNTMRTCMKEFWNITPYKFISRKEFETEKSNKKYSFIVFSEVRQKKGSHIYKYNLLNLILGGKAVDLNEMTDLIDVPLSYIKADQSHYLYKMGGVLLFMQYFVNYNIKHPDTKLSKMVKKISGQVKDKELWLIKDELASDVNTVKKIKKYYPYTVKIVSKEDIKEAIKQRNKNVIFLHKIGPEKTAGQGRCWKFVVSAKDGIPLFYASKKVNSKKPDAFLKKDFKKLAKNN